MLNQPSSGLSATFSRTLAWESEHASARRPDEGSFILRHAKEKYAHDDGER